MASTIAEFSGVHAPDIPFPADKRTPLDWSVAPVATHSQGGPTLLEPTLLERPPLEPPQRAAAATGRLRLFVACDLRGAVRLHAHSAKTHQRLTTYDIRYPDCHQPYDAPLDRDATRLALAEGVSLSLSEPPPDDSDFTDGPPTLWIFAGPKAPPERRPVLLLDGLGGLGGATSAPTPAADAADRAAALHRTLTGIGSLQPFGWMEGCVLDALYDLTVTFPGDGRARTALADHLAVYFPDGTLRYEDPRGRPADDRLYGIEATLPYAVLAKLDPRNPARERAVEAWRVRADDEGCVKDAPTTAEGSYTVAYPMAAIAATADPSLREPALRQLRLRRARLCTGDDLHLRLLPDGTHLYRNWARAYAWYLLGLVRTLTELGEGADTAGLWDEARRVAALALSRRNAAGIWDSYLGEPETGAETCGSAGIAAALALGTEQGQFEARREGAAALRAWEVLAGDHLTEDGWLSGGSPSNKGGEELQRSGYRMLSGVGNGLMGQLGAALVRLGTVKDWTRP
ncbi:MULTISPECIES: glycoside hydrolase family 88 protein [unclassified Streptomyces]|uniref:glycoside hydrolase family 88 protein n=1 Tax=unclassified Streptomyces TaxID=2593676 RepID=UPI0033E7A84A